jgi:hypothetical protein
MKIPKRSFMSPCDSGSAPAKLINKIQYRYDVMKNEANNYYPAKTKIQQLPT